MEEQDLNEVNPPLNSSTGGFTFSLTVVIFFVISLVVGIIVKAAGLDSETDAYVYINYLLSPIAISVGVLIVLKVRKVNFRQFVPVKCHYKYYFIAVLLIYGLLFSLSWVNELSVKFFELFGYNRREATSYFPDLSGGKIIAGLLVMAVLPAVFEELLFRGAILNSLEGSVGSIRTVFLVGFCFSLFHGSPEQTVYQFIAGCAFALIAIRSGSILPSVLMHFINNALIVILSACNCFDEAGELIISAGANIAVMVTSAICLVAAVAILILDKTQVKKCEKGSVKVFFKFASVGIAALGLVWIISLFGVA